MDTLRNTRLITVRDEKQAREWALALLSQGIESTVIEDGISGALALEELLLVMHRIENLK